MTKRIVLVVLGLLLALVGGAAALGGGVLAGVFGSDDTIRSGAHRLATPTRALVTDVARIEHTGGTADTVGDPRIELRLLGDSGARFVGIGPAADVDRFLAGADVDRVRDLDLDPFRLDTARRAGTAVPAPPAAQTFWVARAGAGATDTLAWAIRDGDYAMVVMNADGSPAVDVQASVGLTVPHLFAIAIAVLVAGVALVLAGLVLVVLGLVLGRRGRRQGPAPRVPAQYAGPPPGGWPAKPGAAQPQVPGQSAAADPATPRTTP